MKHFIPFLIIACTPTDVHWHDSGTCDAVTASTTSANVDSDGDGYTADQDCNDADSTINPGASEICDGIDNDCDGNPDDYDDDLEGAVTYFLDDDGDGFASNQHYYTGCNPPDGFIEEGGDCNDEDSSIYPGAAMGCDDLDRNCDGDVDNDIDDDGQSDAECGGSDCDDANASVHVGATEDCADGLDSDCDGLFDDGTIYYVDTDGDGFGDESDQAEFCTETDAVKAGYALEYGDCDNEDGTINPNAIEECDDVDNDCDGTVDEGLGDTYYYDGDADNYGDENASEMFCTIADAYIGGYVPGDITGDGINDLDCDDSSASIYPGATESCDGTDQDCNGIADVILYLEFEAGTGAIAYDTSGGSHNCNITDGTWDSGYDGGGLLFNGETTEVICEHDELMPTSGISLVAWVKPDYVNPDSWDTILSRGGDGTTNVGTSPDSYWMGFHEAELSFYTFAYDSVAGDGDEMTDGLNYSALATWSMVGFTADFSTGERSIYFNGILSATDTDAPVALLYDESPVYIGADINGTSVGARFEGYMDSLMVLDCGVSTTDISSAYTTGTVFGL